MPIPAKPGRPARIDYEYERNGTANVFLLHAPFCKAARHVGVTDRHTAVDYAHLLKRMFPTHGSGMRRRSRSCRTTSAPSGKTRVAVVEAFRPASPSGSQVALHAQTQQPFLNVAETQIKCPVRSVPRAAHSRQGDAD